MGDIPHMGGSMTNDFEFELETNNICSNFLKNHSRLSLKVKKLENIIIDLKKIVCDRDNEIQTQKATFLNKLDIVSGQLITSEIVRKDLEVQITILKDELEDSKKVSKNFANGSENLNKLLGMGKTYGDRKGLGFDNNTHASSSSKTTFVKPTNAFEKSHVSKGKMTSKNLNLQNPKSNCVKINRNKTSSSHALNNKFIPICHFCGAKGHIRPNCYKLLNDKFNFHINVSNKFDVLMKEIVRLNKAVNRKSPDNFINSKQPVSKKVWIRKDSRKSNALDASKKVWTKKSDFKCNVAHVNVNDHKSKPWYLDSACASHMSSDKSCFENLKSSNDCSVIFGNGSSAKVLGKGTISISGIPKVDDSLLVDGLNVNLLSVSKICDNDLSVTFTKTKCEVFNEKGECVLKGQRMFDNCYCVVPSTKPLDHIRF